MLVCLEIFEVSFDNVNFSQEHHAFVGLEGGTERGGGSLCVVVLLAKTFRFLTWLL